MTQFKVIEKFGKSGQFYFIRKGGLSMRIWITKSPRGEGVWRGALIISEGDHVHSYNAKASGYGYNKLYSLITSLIFDASLTYAFSLPAIPRHIEIDVDFFRAHGFEVVES